MPDDSPDDFPDDFPNDFDPIYFMNAEWSARVDAWLDDAKAESFSAGNNQVIDELLRDDDCGLRMVVNIGSDALLGVLSTGGYQNLYEEPVIGGEARQVSETRERVDEVFGLGKDTYFGAVALGGTGIRYYGEYCMVLKRSAVKKPTRLLDRDSYDIFMPPLKDLAMTTAQVERLRGTWGRDLESMAALKVLPEIVHQRRLVTSGTVSEAVLRDQEFIEIHLDEAFGVTDLEEIRESPDEVAIEARISSKQAKQRHVTAVEAEWLRRRDVVADGLEQAGIRSRVVTLHGRGYQWR